MPLGCLVTPIPTQVSTIVMLSNVVEQGRGRGIADAGPPGEPQPGCRPPGGGGGKWKQSFRSLAKPDQTKKFSQNARN